MLREERILKLSFNPRPPRGRRQQLKKSIIFKQVSIHAPRVGGDGARIDLVPNCKSFNPRPPRGRRLGISSERIKNVSIHAPRVGGDPLWRTTTSSKC